MNDTPGLPIICVTGANGFVGRHLLRLLTSRGHTVRAAVRLAMAPILPPAEDIHYQQSACGNVGPDTDWSAFLEGADCVVHLAARVHVMHDSHPDPESAFREVNVLGTKRLAEQAADAGVRRLVFVSTAKVNGEGRAAPYTPADAPAPDDAYARSKHQAEMALAEVCARTGLECVIVRPPLVYGPGVGANFLRLMRAVDNGLPLPLGAIHNRRSLLFSGNLADVLATCAAHPNAAGHTFLASDGEDVSTPDLIRRIARALGRRARLWNIPPSLLALAAALTGRGPAIRRLTGSLAVDASALRDGIGWTPPFSLDQGLAETADWFIRSRRMHPGARQ
ncbi:nucleoside-diphosphate-sugar epimerase [Desulfobaculum xiamenense]|uniref:Nucleoside-diphosphate-sugar epimerase n=1 Tax=Desulfobaculum xiamenense TaxID=995050 RepID=A0A846QKR3_9BACT|nr:SDR family oxidoreductase [Desulfobaculum xiamenense]NJB67042.1 nucleoside-diphosphate-sugar epimerase [Desulfobaculum xiamenense]